LSKQYKLDFRTLAAALDRRDIGWLAKQPEDVAKAFSLNSLRFASGVIGKREALYALWLINRRANVHFFTLNDKDLSYRLLASCGQGRLRREWIAARRPSQGNAAVDALLDHHSLANEAEARMLLSLHSRASFAQFLADCGKMPDEMKACLNAYDKLGG
jgi:hypothetical protein